VYYFYIVSVIVLVISILLVVLYSFSSWLVITGWLNISFFLSWTDRPTYVYINWIGNKQLSSVHLAWRVDTTIMQIKTLQQEWDVRVCANNGRTPYVRTLSIQRNHQCYI
jgi:hypothetical protein